MNINVLTVRKVLNPCPTLRHGSVLSAAFSLSLSIHKNTHVHSHSFPDDLQKELKILLLIKF